jgi:hypothetical protein
MRHPLATCLAICLALSSIGAPPTAAQNADLYAMRVIVTPPSTPPANLPVWWRTWNAEISRNTLSQLTRGHNTVMYKGEKTVLPPGYIARQSVLVGPTWTLDGQQLTPSANLTFGCDPAPQGATVTQTWEMCPARVAIDQAGSLTILTTAEKICAIYTGADYGLNPTTDATTVEINTAQRTITFDAIQHGEPIPGCRVAIAY